MNHEKVQKLIRELLVEMGEDPDREGLVDTPARVARSYEFLTSGYHQSQAEIIGSAVFTQQVDHMVIVRDIELYSLCEHHLLPFFGRCHLGYIADGTVLGVSKLARLVDMYARRLQIQERLTEQVAQAIMDQGAAGAGVVIEAQHLCMMMRGVEKQNSLMTTSAVLGTFRHSPTTRNEFQTLIARSRPRTD